MGSQPRVNRRTVLAGVAAGALSARASKAQHGAPEAGPPADYEFEPSPTDILEQLLPRYAEARVYAALLNAAASEHAARQRVYRAMQALRAITRRHELGLDGP